MKHFAFPTKYCLLLGCVLLGSAAQADIYKTVDEHGNVTYSDKADGSDSTVDLNPANSLPAVKTPSAHTGDEEQEAEDGPVSYKTLKISSPANDSAIEHGPGDFTVEVRIAPALAAGDKIQLLLDGKAHGAPSTNTSFDLKNVYRGTHTLQVKVKNAAGKVLKKSKTSTVHVFRPSVLQPGYRG